MRFGCCGSMVASSFDGTGVEVIEQLKKIGFDYIELSLSHIMALSEKDFYKLKDRVSFSGLSCECCNNFFPAYLKLTGMNVDMDKVTAYTEKALERARQLGVKIVVFGSGLAKKVPEDYPMEKAWDQLIDLLRFVHTVAKKYGIIIVLEPLRKAECNIVNTVEEAYKLVRDTDRENIKLLVDFYHMSIEQEKPNIIESTGEYIKHVHLARVENRVFPKYIDEDNYLPFINNLQKIGYSDRISIEAYSKDFYNDAVQALKFLNNFCNIK